MRSFICLAMVKKACSTLVADLAEVSRNGMLSPSAYSLATVYSTTFLSVMSDLLPTSSLLTPSVAYRSISCSHALTLRNVSATRQFCSIHWTRKLLLTLVGDIVNHDDTVRSPVVRGCDCPETFLACGIPLVVCISFRTNRPKRRLTICSLTVFPSSSIVLIFC